MFLGMSASSVPIRPVINDIFEDLTQAGVRFVYFSPRNMRRSQKVAEKIGECGVVMCEINLRNVLKHFRYSFLYRLRNRLELCDFVAYPRSRC